MDTSRPSSISRNLYLLTGCAILPALVILLWTGLAEREKAMEEARQRLASLANGVAGLQAERTGQARVMARTLASLSEVQTRDRAACDALFGRVLAGNPALANIVLIDPDGNVAASGLPLDGPLNIADRPAFRNAVRSMDFSAGEYIQSVIAKIPVFHFSLPVRGPDGGLAGVLFVAQRLDEYGQIFEGLDMPPESRVLVADRKGVRLMARAWGGAPPPVGDTVLGDNWERTRSYPQDRGAFVATRSDKVQALIHFQRLRLAPDREPYMTVFTSAPLSVVLAEPNRVLAANLLLMALAGLLALAAARFLGRVLVGRQVEALRDREEHLEALYQHSLDAILLTSPDGRIHKANPAAERLFGLSEAEIIAAGRHGLADPTDERLPALLAERERTGGASGEMRFRRRGGETFEAEVSSTIFPLAGEARTSMIIRDVSVRKAAEAEMLRGMALAEAAARSKSEFLANMSHEIRTPLSGIMGMLELLRTSPLDERQAGYLQAALTASRRLTRLLADILDLSRIEAGRLALRESAFSPREVRDAIRDLFAPAARDKGIELTVSLAPDLPARLAGDEARLVQILFNLAGNAVKFTRDGSVRVEAWPLPGPSPDRVRVLFCVADTGPGIPDATLQTMFEPFVQGEESRSRTHQGAGLGLPIVRKLVRLMDGELAMDNSGPGLAAWLSLPFGLAAPEREPDPAISPAPERRAAPMRILLAEDDPINLLAGVGMLESAGHQVTTARNGREVLDRLRETETDMVILDVQMPDMDGLEAARRIRAGEAGEACRAVPILAMTGYAMPGDREAFLASGMDDCLAKPVTPDLLHRAVARVLEGRARISARG